MTCFLCNFLLICQTGYQDLEMLIRQPTYSHLRKYQKLESMYILLQSRYSILLFLSYCICSFTCFVLILEWRRNCVLQRLPHLIYENFLKQVYPATTPHTHFYLCAHPKPNQIFCLFFLMRSAVCRTKTSTTLCLKKDCRFARFKWIWSATPHTLGLCPLYWKDREWTTFSYNTLGRAGIEWSSSSIFDAAIFTCSGIHLYFFK